MQPRLGATASRTENGQAYASEGFDHRCMLDALAVAVTISIVTIVAIRTLSINGAAIIAILAASVTTIIIIAFSIISSNNVRLGFGLICVGALLRVNGQLFLAYALPVHKA